MLASYGIDVDQLVIALFVISLILIGLVIYLIVQMRMWKMKYKYFMSGKDGRSLENAIARRVDQLDKIMTDNEEIKKSMKRFKTKNSNGYNRLGILKYDAFDNGGELSFAICLLNETGDGFVLNSLYTMDGCYTYLKEIINGHSFTKLSVEEQEAVDRAKGIED